jgi:hypothetical protein
LTVATISCPLAPNFRQRAAERDYEYIAFTDHPERPVKAFDRREQRGIG